MTSTPRGRAVEAARAALAAADLAAKATAAAYISSPKYEEAALEEAALEAVHIANYEVMLAYQRVQIALGARPATRLPAYPGDV